MRSLPATDEVRRPTKFAHFVLRTKHFTEALAWYQKVLGAEVVFNNDFLAFLTYDDEHHRLALVNDPASEVPEKRPPGLDHVAYTYASMEDLLGSYERLKSEGIMPVWTINHGPTTSMYYADPDGNRVELQIDNFESVETLNAWFKSGEFAKNPIGVEFDPERLVERYRAGDPIEALVAQGSA